MSTSFFPIVIHHNPDCGTPRNALDLIHAAGFEPTIIRYLETGWARPQLRALFAAAGMTAREALRATKPPAVALSDGE
jgi:arsenate reductase